ncbi:hypothetical protein L085_07640 [Serratia sp. FS14]|nr:hypothetical protein L085_07640 [Serratia sp. FS14]
MYFFLNSEQLTGFNNGFKLIGRTDFNGLDVRSRRQFVQNIFPAVGRRRIFAIKIFSSFFSAS